MEVRRAAGDWAWRLAWQWSRRRRCAQSAARCAQLEQAHQAEGQQARTAGDRRPDDRVARGGHGVRLRRRYVNAPKPGFLIVRLSPSHRLARTIQCGRSSSTTSPDACVVLAVASATRPARQSPAAGQHWRRPVSERAFTNGVFVSTRATRQAPSQIVTSDGLTVDSATRRRSLRAARPVLTLRDRDQPRRDVRRGPRAPGRSLTSRGRSTPRRPRRPPSSRGGRRP